MAGGDVKLVTHVHYRDDLGRFAKAIDRGAQEAIIDVSTQGAATAKVLAPKKTGRMAATIQPFSTGGGSGGWAVGMDYSMPQEFGAGPHSIGAEGQVLANKEDQFFAIGPVMHPGNPATHFMKKSYNIMKGRIMGIVRRHMP